MAKREKPSYSAEDFDLDVLDSEDDMFRWLLAAYLFGKPIQASVATQTWQLFIDKKLDTPWAIADIPRRKLVHLLDEGKYTRYDESMATALQKCMGQLISWYEGSLYIMLDQSANEDEFAKRLKELFGIGPKTAEIFMRSTAEYFARRLE